MAAAGPPVGHTDNTPQLNAMAFLHMTRFCMSTWQPYEVVCRVGTVEWWSFHRLILLTYQMHMQVVRALWRFCISGYRCLCSHENCHFAAKKSITDACDQPRCHNQICLCARYRHCSMVVHSNLSSFSSVYSMTHQDCRRATKAFHHLLLAVPSHFRNRSKAIFAPIRQGQPGIHDHNGKLLPIKTVSLKPFCWISMTLYAGLCFASSGLLAAECGRKDALFAETK